MTTNKNFQRLPALNHQDENGFEQMIEHLAVLQRDLIDSWANVEHKFKSLDPQAKKSARNLVYYVALRRRDVRELQNNLARHGFSSLGRSESYVMTNINKVLKLLHRIVQRRFHLPPECKKDISLDQGRLFLKNRSQALLGKEPRHRKVRIMVTLPGEAADNYNLVRDLIANGMNCARINCAHDQPDDWRRMVENIKRAQKSLKLECKICFDIAGPKLRTGAIEAGPNVLKLSPTRDVFGGVLQPARILLTTAENLDSSISSGVCRITVSKDFLHHLQVGDKIKFRDARNARRTLTVREIDGDNVRAECRRTSYITPDSKFKIQHHSSKLTTKPGNIAPLEQTINLQKGDFLVLTRDQKPGEPARFGENGEILKPARVPCTLLEVFDCVKPGENVWFNDGKIGGVIKSVSSDEILVEITHPTARMQKLRSDKGINLPDSDLRFPSLTEKDLADIEFIVKHADLIGYSFVRSASDVIKLQDKLKELKSDHLGIVLKIETRRAFENLPAILLTALSSPSVGVMIARGDLAIETGFERLAEVQEEILWMCEAAHVPVIWATQVLEELSKNGVYTRAEITDAAMSERAECVMLNKGLFVVEAVRALDDILARMGAHQYKKRPMLRHLHLADRFFDLFKKANNNGQA